MLSRTATSKLDNHKKCQQNQHIRMIANNEDLRNDAENSALHHINQLYILHWKTSL